MAHNAPVSWSPDGEWLVFIDRTVADPTVTELFVRRFSAGSGNGGQQITFGSERVLFPAWSPTGEWIVFVRSVPGAPMQLWKVRPDGTDLQRFDATPTGQLMPTWAPDGRSLAYLGIDGLRVTQVDGSGSVRIRPDLSFVEIDFAPDGRSLVAIQFLGACQRAVVRIDLISQIVTPLTSPMGSCTTTVDVPAYPAWGN